MRHVREMVATSVLPSSESEGGESGTALSGDGTEVGCGMVVSERHVFQGATRTFEGEEEKNHHGQAPRKHISEPSQLCTSLGPCLNGKKASRDYRKIHAEIGNRSSKYGKENKQTRVEFKDHEIFKASIHFENEIASLAMNPRVKNIALAHFAPYRREKEQIRDVEKWYAACLVIGLDEGTSNTGQLDRDDAAPATYHATSVVHVIPAPASPQGNIKLAPPTPVRQWVPPPPPKKKRKHSCLFHSAPKQIQRGDTEVTKKRDTGKGPLVALKKRRLSTATSSTSQTAADVKRLLSPVLALLMEHKYGWVFNEEVDPKKLNLPDYFEIVKKPMDLGTVKAKLDSFLYQLPQDFADDMRLTFCNAMLYNKPGSEVHALARGMLRHFEQEYLRALGLGNEALGSETAQMGK
jgi:hypothetical protein